MRKKLVFIIGLGHLCSDLNQGALPALLPYFIAIHHFNYATAAGLVFAPNLVSSILQPFFGWLADRFSISWLVPVGIITAGVGVQATIMMPTYGWMMAVVSLSGLGLAAFHPEGARLVSYVSAEKKATAMSIFTVGGNIGFAVGPVLTVACITWFGLRGVLFMLLPGLLIATIFFLNAQEFRRVDPSQKAESAEERRQVDAWLPFSLLTGATFCRSIVFFGLNTFLALYWITQLHQTKAAGNTALGIFIFIGALGTVIGGALADSVGRYRIVLTSLLIIPPFLLLFLQIHTPLLALLALAPLGFALFASFNVMIVMGQQFLPHHRGVASGVMLGAAGSIGGVTTPLFGYIADHHGLRAALLTLEVAACLAVFLAIATLRAANAHTRRQAELIAQS
jgi:MFS transporter, FSR family, fosmidomycin resistance protein